jgi:cell division protein FtsQ
MGHVWVLHRRLILQGLAALFAVVMIAGLYQGRAVLGAAGEAVVGLIQGEFVTAGFGIRKIEISGQKLTSDADIATVMALSSGASTLTFDVQKAQARLSWLRAVESATVRKIYPDSIAVDIVEKEPILRWRIGDWTYLIDDTGTAIARDPGSYADLPLVVGHGANDDALVMVGALERHPAIRQNLAALSRIGDRRWDLIYYTGLRVQLPERGIAQALDRLDMYQRDYALLDRDVTQIDLRVPGMVALKPSVREDADGQKGNP